MEFHQLENLLVYATELNHVRKRLCRRYTNFRALTILASEIQHDFPHSALSIHRSELVWGNS